MSNQISKISLLLFNILLLLLLSQNIINVTSIDVLFEFEIDTGNTGGYGMILFDDTDGEEYVSYALTGFEDAATVVDFTISSSLSTVARFYLVSTQDNTDLVKFTSVSIDGVSADMNNCNYGSHCGLQDEDLDDDFCQILNIVDANSAAATAYVDENMEDADICHMTFTDEVETPAPTDEDETPAPTEDDEFELPNSTDEDDIEDDILYGSASSGKNVGFWDSIGIFGQIFFVFVILFSITVCVRIGYGVKVTWDQWFNEESEDSFEYHY